MKLRQLIASRMPIALYLRLKNVKNALTHVDVRYLLKYGKIAINSEGLSWLALRSRIDFYGKGLAHRGFQIGGSYLLDSVVFKDNDVVIDCGANMGDLQLYFVSLGLNIRYVGIEPNPIDFSCLKANLIVNAVAFNIGLWDSSSKLPFYIDKYSSSSSIIEPKNYSEIIEIETKRLDSLELPNEIKLLKVEGEGAEPEILKGCFGILDRIEYISVDAGPERGIAESETIEEVSNYLLSNNFNILKANTGKRKTIIFRNLKF